MRLQFLWPAALVLVAACSQQPPAGTVIREGFFGGIATDEPRATLVGRDVLTGGGSAVDAAVAAMLTLAVTYPSAAGIGGGGTCLVFDGRASRVETLDFQSPASGSDRQAAVPGLVRGLFALHAKYGRLRWERLVVPAEDLARFGTPVSRALAQDLAAAGSGLLADAGTARVFGRRDGAALRLAAEGEPLVQLELAATLTRLRNAGAGDLHTGQLARLFLEGAERAGLSADAGALRDGSPRWLGSVHLPVGVNELHVAPPPAAGPAQALIVGMLADGNRFGGAAPEERDRLLIDASGRAFADRGRALVADGAGAGDALQRVRGLAATLGDGRTAPTPAAAAPDLPATAVVAVDREGGAAACGLTMNGLFGSGRMAGETGVLIAPAIGDAAGARLPGPMLLVNRNSGTFLFAAAGGGRGGPAATATAAVALRTLIAGEPLAAAVAGPRVHHAGDGDAVRFEPTLSRERQDALIARGRAQATPGLGRVNAIYCPGGLPRDPKSCAVAVDPRGFGLATSADR